MASLSNNEIRKLVMTCPKYDSPNWHARVNKMSDRQVYAIYRNFVRFGYFDEQKQENKNPEICHQISIFEYLAEKENRMRTYFFKDGFKKSIEGFLSPIEIKKLEEEHGEIQDMMCGTKIVRAL